VLKLEPFRAGVDDWGRAVSAFPEHHVFHTPAWLAYVAETQGGTPVLATLTDGRELSDTVRFARGSPENPMSRTGLVAKYDGCAALSVDASRAARALALLESLEEVPSVSTLMDVLRG